MLLRKSRRKKRPLCIPFPAHLRTSLTRRFSARGFGNTSSKSKAKGKPKAGTGAPKSTKKSANKAVAQPVSEDSESSSGVRRGNSYCSRKQQINLGIVALQAKSGKERVWRLDCRYCNMKVRRNTTLAELERAQLLSPAFDAFVASLISVTVQDFSLVYQSIQLVHACEKAAHQICATTAAFYIVGALHLTKVLTFLTRRNVSTRGKVFARLQCTFCGVSPQDRCAFGLNKCSTVLRVRRASKVRIENQAQHTCENVSRTSQDLSQIFEEFWQRNGELVPTFMSTG
ncbi:hypothetical protein GGX14DRAFT_399305 [Mycena pura]|uniref:Uncharacterized protein n=1 Tax=Mycena pura TaxID=153505 RepID=A0AAD6V4U4_9AGAR|nr:hypothetical protein GGX14DRAFT_399305 [Mycena pura]